MFQRFSSGLARAAILGMVTAGCGPNSVYSEKDSNVKSNAEPDMVITASFDAGVSPLEIITPTPDSVANDESATLETTLISAYSKNKLGENLALVPEESPALFCNASSDCPGKTVCDASGCVQYNSATSITDKVCSGFLEEVLDTGKPASLSESPFLPIGNNLTINDYFCTIKPLASDKSTLDSVIGGTCFGSGVFSLLAKISSVSGLGTIVIGAVNTVCSVYGEIQEVSNSLTEDQAETLINTFESEGINPTKSKMLLCNIEYSGKVCIGAGCQYNSSAICVYPAQIVLENSPPKIWSQKEISPIATAKSYAQDFSITVTDDENDGDSEKLFCAWSYFDEYTYNAIQSGKAVMLPAPTSLSCDEVYHFFTPIEGLFYVEVKFVDQGSKKFTFLDVDYIYHQTPEISWGIDEQKSGNFMFEEIGAYFEKASNSCVSHASKTCLDNSVYWNDSCGYLEEKITDCAKNQYCESGECKLNAVICLNKCDYIGEITCFDDNHFVECVSDDYGCLDWSYNDCGWDEICVDGECQMEIPECTVEGTLCIGDTIYQEDSCGGLTKVKECSGSQYCESGQCESYTPSCVDECDSVGDKTCSGNSVAECVKNSDGCLEWSYNGCGSKTCKNGECLTDNETPGYQCKPCKTQSDCGGNYTCVISYGEPDKSVCKANCETSNDCLSLGLTCTGAKRCGDIVYGCYKDDIWMFDECNLLAFKTPFVDCNSGCEEFVPFNFEKCSDLCTDIPEAYYYCIEGYLTNSSKCLACKK